ncbi:MAG: hypothetical protein AAGK97_13905, partial [Bacteroidota bacterium]
MRIRITTILLCFLFLSNAQQTIIFPQQYDDALKGKEINEEITFYSYPYISSLIDVRDIKKKYPELNVENQIQITPPNLARVNSVHVLMGVLADGVEKKLLIWLVGDQGTHVVTFFVDTNMDRNFTNDGDPKPILAGDPPTEISIYPNGKDALPRKIGIKVPKPGIDGKSKRILFRGRRVKMNYNFAIGFHVGVGAGRLTYDFDNLDTGFPTWYT